MGIFTTRQEECLEKIAHIMSEKSLCTVSVDDVHLEVSRPTTSIYTAVVPSSAGNTCIVCTVRKWKNPREYVVQTS